MPDPELMAQPGNGGGNFQQLGGQPICLALALHLRASSILVVRSVSAGSSLSTNNSGTVSVDAKTGKV
jgi:hypothetical protein